MLDLIRERLGARERSRSLESVLWGPVTVSGEKVFLLKPMTYMNLSGVAVKRVFNSLDLDLDDMIVIYDDIALPFGRIRLRARGSAGGHKGMISIIGHLGSLEFPRLRIGIDGEEQRRNLSDYVTEPFSPSEMIALPSVCGRGGDVVLLWIARGIEEAMREANSPRERKADSELW